MAEQNCPRCDATLDGHLALDGDDAGPTPGDITVCAYCATAMIFGEDHKLRPVTPAVWDELSIADQFNVAQMRLRVQRLHGNEKWPGDEKLKH